MVIVRFPDEATHKRAPGFLVGKYSGHPWVTGEGAVPDEALAPMERGGLTFTVERPASYDRIRSLRDSFTTAA